ncbi:MAG TPA: MazG-like family protein [Candidatus Paceibacterota bacterium]|nr:MazG-like family protein [Candidatus Paceibacterota bacterium]
MRLDEFQNFIDEQDALFRKVKDTNQTERERVLARAVKLAEEFGELSNEVLAFVGDQRKDKLTEHSPQTLKDEFADVLIVTFLLAKAMDVDVMATLDHKIQKIREKHNKQL